MNYSSRVDILSRSNPSIVPGRAEALNEKIDERVSRFALSKIGTAVADACLSLINRMVTWIKLAADWIIKLFFRIFGCMKRAPEEDREVVNAGVPPGDPLSPVPSRPNPPVSQSKDLVAVPNSIVRSDPIGLEVVPTKAEGARPVSFAEQIRQSSHLTFEVGQSSLRLPNPFSSEGNLSRDQRNRFREEIADFLSLAVPHPHYHIKINQGLSVQIDNPGYGRQPSVKALLDHSTNSLQAIMRAPSLVLKDKPLIPEASNSLQGIESIDSKNYGQRLLAVRGSASDCPFTHCAQTTMVLNAPYFRIELENEQILIHNPFSGRVKPSDDEVYQFNLNVGRVLEMLKGRSTLRIGLGESAAVSFRIPKNAILSPRFLTTGLLQIANSHKAIRTAQLSIPAQAISDSNLAPRLIKQSPDLTISVIPLPVPESEGKVVVSVLRDQTACSIQQMAAEQYVEKPKVNGDLSRFPAIDSRAESLSGRNQLLNYLDGISMVWDQHSTILGHTIQYCVELGERNIPLSEKQKEEIRTFFDKVKAAPQLDLQFYLKNRIALQRILSPRLDALMSIENPSRNEQLEVNLAKAELATSFGYGIVPTGAGKNGAMYIKTFEDRPVGVFKAPKALGVFDLIERAKQYLGQARLLNKEPMAQEYAEVVAADLSRVLGFTNIAPEAVMAKFAGQRGAFISFLDGYQELSKVKDVVDRRDEFDREEVKKWQMGVIWNALIHNLDPHDYNIFVVVKGGKLEALTMIDHGNCFPVYNPGLLGGGNLGAYGGFRISKIRFLSEVREFIKEKITEDALNAFFDSNEERKRFFLPAMRKLQLERVRLLRMVAEKVIKDPVELSKIQTDSDFSNYLDMQNEPLSESLERSSTDLIQTLQIMKE